MNACETWTQPDQPLTALARLARSASREALLETLVDTTSRLAGGELSQLYLLDDSHTRLTLSAESLDGQVSVHSATSLPSDYRDEQLLQYCLCQNRTLALDELDASLHATGFLPASLRPWRSLLCLPLPDTQGQVAGLLVSASRQRRDLSPSGELLAELGGFVINQLRLLQRAEPARTEPPTTPAASRPTVTGNAYGLIGDSAGMRRVYQLLGKVLHVPITVLVRGETGTGKELVARQLHAASGRRGRFVALNCGAISESLLEAELFGYNEGAFTGARRGGRVGLVEAAEGGTLFLDEIGELPLPLQTRLLRVLEEREVLRVGATEPTPVDVRVVAATLQTLESLVDTQRFRRDLYYRLAALRIALPTLRDRRADVPLLVSHFFRQLADTDSPLSPEALARLRDYAWPGNVRELRNMVDRLRIHWQQQPGALTLPQMLQWLPELHAAQRPLAVPGGGIPAALTAASTARPDATALRRLLADCGGNREQACALLGVSRTTLWRWLREGSVG